MSTVKIGAGCLVWVRSGERCPTIGIEGKNKATLFAEWRLRRVTFFGPKIAMDG
jgi:hypothetical protein